MQRLKLEGTTANSPLQQLLLSKKAASVIKQVVL